MRATLTNVDDRVWRYNRFNALCTEFKKGCLYWHFSYVNGSNKPREREQILLERCIAYSTNREADDVFELLSELPSTNENIPTIIELAFGSLAGDINRKGTQNESKGRTDIGEN